MNLYSNKKFLDKKIEKWIKEIQNDYIKNMNKKLPILNAKITTIKINTKEKIALQNEWDPEELLNQI